MDAFEFRRRAAIELFAVYSTSGQMSAESAARIAVEEARILTEAYDAELKAWEAAHPSQPRQPPTATPMPGPGRPMETIG